LIIAYIINFEIVFHQNNNDMADYLSSIFAKLNLVRNYSTIIVDN